MLPRSTGKKTNRLQVYNSFLDLLQNSGARPIFVKLPPPFMFPHFLPMYRGQRGLGSVFERNESGQCKYIQKVSHIVAKSQNVVDKIDAILMQKRFRRVCVCDI
ncbi:hypothetical protein TNIN_167591 [Trichonephila inaurata madagascariensis]|uniref:Uncharacterized protein n=1 Tax=Trichonephila inaurata madagascariensis TaxID=2747483 RepID=A0A8X6XGN8_9ARAC|nr:hypothetical protein TNIN_167591 [Trichonephila inaurata madagascariensis]